MAKWPNHFISGKQLQKGQMATLGREERTERRKRERGESLSRENPSKR